MKYYVLYEYKGHWHVRKGHDTKEAALAEYRKINKRYSVAHTTNIKIAKAVHEHKPSSKAFEKFCKKHKIKVREVKGEPQIIRIALPGSVMAKGTMVMDINTAVDLLFGNADMTAWIKEKIRERLEAEGFSTKYAEYRVVKATDNLEKAEKLSYYQNTRRGSFVERSAR